MTTPTTSALSSAGAPDATPRLAADDAPVGERRVAEVTSSREEEASVESGLRAEVIGEAGEMGALADDWLRLQAAAGRDIHFFQTYEWCGAWVNRGMDGRRERPLIVCVRRDDDLVLLWPLMLTRMGPLRIMRWLSDPFAQYGDVLTSLDGAALGAALDVAWRRILATGGVDIVRLRHVRADSTVGNFLAGRCLLADEDGAPWLDLSRFDDEAAYDRRYDRRQRRRRKRIRKRLEKDFGEVAFRFVGPVDVAGVVDRLVAEKRRWLEEKGYYSRPLECPELAGFFRCLPVAATSEEAMEDVPLMVVSELVAGDRAVSWELSFRWRGRHYCYITAHDNDLTPYSPGRLHMDLSQKRALADGVVAFDLLVSNAPHKRSWSSDVMPVRDYYLPLTLRGRMIGAGYLRLLRPAVRRLYPHVPGPFRRVMARVAGSGLDQGVGGMRRERAPARAAREA